MTGTLAVVVIERVRVVISMFISITGTYCTLQCIVRYILVCFIADSKLYSQPGREIVGKGRGNRI